MLKIWGRKNSSNVRKALWCAEELGLSYQALMPAAPLVWWTLLNTGR